MNMMGDIVEHGTQEPVMPTFPTGPMPTMAKRKPSAWRKRLAEKGIASMSGTVEGRADTGSGASERYTSTNGLKSFVDPSEKKMDYSGMSEAEKINQENIEVLSLMTPAQREQEKQELIDSLDPLVLQALMKRAYRKPGGEEPVVEGYGTWIGGTKEDDRAGRNSDESAWVGLDSADVDKALGVTRKALPKEEIGSGGQEPLLKEKEQPKEREPPKMREPPTEKCKAQGEEAKKVRFESAAEGSDSESGSDFGLEDATNWEDVEYLDDLGPSFEAAQALDEQSMTEILTSVHFPRRQTEDVTESALDLNDPEFNRKLHEKYFPDLPVDTAKLKWMEPVAVTAATLVYDNINELRFDFRGNLLLPEDNALIPSHAGLHHHSEDAQMAGYTFRELAHLSRSKMNSQRCIAIQTWGRILHKLGKKAYRIAPESGRSEGDEPADPDQPELLTWEGFAEMCWEVIRELRVIETLEESANERLTPNLSVRNYAIEALWLWKSAAK